MSPAKLILALSRKKVEKGLAEPSAPRYKGFMQSNRWQRALRPGKETTIGVYRPGPADSREAITRPGFAALPTTVCTILNPFPEAAASLSK